MKSSVKQAVEVISSLISLSHSIKVFNVKWQLIRKKLEELSSGLMAVESCNDSSENTAAFSDLVPSILVTVNECCDLARRCVDLSYSGKLLMQSDLDVMAAKVGLHVKNISGIWTAGVLTHGSAIVVSRPGLGACKDDMRFYVRDLLTRMKIGDTEMKRQALVSLYQVMDEDERYVKLVALEVGDIVKVLVDFLDSPEMEIQEEASKIVSLMSGFDLYKRVLVECGIVGPLNRVLETGSRLSREGAVKCLQTLTVNSDNAWSVSAHGGVTALLKICSSSEFGGELIGLACGVLRNLVGVEEIKSRVPSTYIFRDELVHETVVKAGGIRALVRISDPKSATSSKTREVALRTIENLCFSSQNHINMLMNYMFTDHLLFFLRNGEVSLQELALKLTFRLCGTSDDAKKTIGDAGFMPELARLLNAKSYDMREMAIETLSSLVSVPRNRKRFVQDDRNIQYLLQLLDEDEGISGNKQLLLSILMSLTSCNSGRRKIASSGYLKNIEKLAEEQVSDAKRLVRKLSSNRFHSFLSRFWHS
ncbi:F-box protein [Hibiscus syriacus]|uniref:F-box protein n=1 Tax=Hibiscus syriacus TaxID=106335 RepID=A0A6A2ZDL5_HIBSY|nr:F-box protein [Hibiscus syriacus]